MAQFPQPILILIHHGSDFQAIIFDKKLAI